MLKYCKHNITKLFCFPTLIILFRLIITQSTLHQMKVQAEDTHNFSAFEN